MFWNLLICFGIVWIIQSFFSFLQGVYMKNTIKVLSEYGKVFMGRNAGFPRTSLIVMAAIDTNHHILKARKVIPARIFRMPKIVDFDELNGLKAYSNSNADTPSENYDKKTNAAISNLFSNYLSYKRQNSKQ